MWPLTLIAQTFLVSEIWSLSWFFEFFFKKTGFQKQLEIENLKPTMECFQVTVQAIKSAI